MAPIQRLAAGPLSIITGALMGALSGPNSSPPSNGTNATVWGTEYRGTASFFNLTLDSTPSPISSPTSTSSSSIPSPTASLTTPTSSSSLVYFNSQANTYTGCNNQTFSSTDNVALMNPLQFNNNNIDTTSSTCGQWIQIQNRANTQESTYAQIVGVCDDCEYGSVSLSLGALSELAPDLLFDEMVFDGQSDLTIANLTDPVNPLPPSTPISPKDLLDVKWQLSEAPEVPSPSAPAPIPTSTTTTATTTTTTTKTITTTIKTTKTSAPTKKSPPPSEPTKETPAPKPSSKPPGGKGFTGKATWYSDTFGQCEQHYSQSDMIVAVNQAQMGTGKNLCGKKILLTKKGSNTQVVVTVVDMCPGKYCKFGDLDLSRAAFQKFADLDVGVLQLQWSFI
ncbi:hypothetical protein BC939DRAFT_480577 [Gamsiella multidivaricata]|uniref:uncharacterized protein n=1 Tax=Gamsiella multidivaricata TaxID=101098 RepID=UPI00222052D7|nr:uncharacterized protein BC939DRAFT_480577 [Gamsiella multidivaricata]KAG0367042.1 hypothetical protein BGZ54_004528 [Gamsiella multidivaricata]KAI7818133.1 hypothetical protein BC939DRAFT_480577 [Gamsiella multidivaricata]